MPAARLVLHPKKLWPPIQLTGAILNYMMLMAIADQWFYGGLDLTPYYLWKRCSLSSNL